MLFRNILLIDDDEDDQEIFLSAVRDVSELVACQCMSDATTALEKLKAREITPDLIFLDLNMPIMSGQQFLSELTLKDELRHIPVYIFTTTSQKSAIEATKALGASDFFTKPNKYEDLVVMLSTIIG